MLFWLPCLFLWRFLIKFLFKIDVKYFSTCPSSCDECLFNAYSKSMQNALLVALSPLVMVVPNLTLNQNWCKMFFWLPCLLLWRFPVQCAFGLFGCLASSCGGIPDWCKIFLWLPCLLLWWPLVQCLLEIDAKCSSGCLGGASFNP